MPVNSVNFSDIQPNNVNNITNSSMNRLNETEQKSNFGEFLTNAINDVNGAQIQSDIATDKLARGEDIELHNVMITAQKASISMQTALEVRNKAVEAYQEIMRMQV
ncbi:flagellar hook-basal body complex protein FliE [Lederbergia lenta]|uniref:Flagellar hook-basal body complex protein FliE n=1 Tax=Lederbergia lenta TaxID=1467 RepID=A0A2X4W6H7_LEDLE|nr:flagellar hook-basal body complex protein FliE [Lederbergia lenta]MEC2324274.1 flagellar hook-basal body complex protein FliE [Lederbergia lenta]SQI60237.1 flagellar hook-basal body complex protein FliE [Lederbergia lenta]